MYLSRHQSKCEKVEVTKAGRLTEPLLFLCEDEQCGTEDFGASSIVRSDYLICYAFFLGHLDVSL